jgi:hypothetical protein
MNDKEAFEKWQSQFKPNELYTVEEAWYAALSHERQRSAKLVSTLEKISSNWSEDPRNEAHAALKEYYASGEGER